MTYPLVPMLRVQYALASNGWGLMLQPRQCNTDTLDSLLSVAGYSQTNCWFERNTGFLMLRPVPRAQSMGASDINVNVRGGDAGVWADAPSRDADAWIKEISQKDRTPGKAWSAETKTQVIDLPNGPFQVRIKRGPPPKQTGTTEVTAATYYTRIVFPSDSAGVQFRVVLAYEQPPLLEHSADGGVTFTTVGPIPCSADMSRQRRGDLDVTLTVCRLGTQVCVWLDDINNPTLTYGGFDGLPIDYPAGKIRFEGQNGAAQFGFSHLRFAASGGYTSPWKYGSNYLDSKATFQFLQIVAAGMTVSGAITAKDYASKSYQYTATLTSPNLTSDATKVDFNYSASTPLVQGVTVDWPPVYLGSPMTGWRDVPNIKRMEEHSAFDPNTLVVSRSFGITVANDFAEWVQNKPNQMLRIHTGWQHLGWDLRGIVVGNTETEFTALGPTGEATFRCDDHMQMLGEQATRDLILPGGWCVYSLCKMLLEHGGLTPELTRFIPDCIDGPNAALLGCPHTTYPLAGIRWEPLTPILTCLAELQNLEGAVMGTNRYGYFLFYRFRPEAPVPPPRIVYSSQGAHKRYGYLNAALARNGGVRRFSSSKGVRNLWILGGADQQTGELFTVSSYNWMSIFDRLAPNYKGYFSPYIRMWSGYIDEAFAREEMARISYFSNLPAEQVTVPCLGTPLQPLDVFGIVDPRTVGSRSTFYATDILSVFDAARSAERTFSFDSMLSGAWTMSGTLPGG